MSARLTVERMFAHAKHRNLRLHFAIGGMWTYMTDIELVVTGAAIPSRTANIPEIPGLDHFASLTHEAIERFKVPELVASDLYVYGRILNTDELRATGKSEKFEIGLLVDTNKIDIVGFSDPKEHVY